MTSPQGRLIYRAQARDARRAALLVIAGVIPVAAHPEQLCDEFAAQGYDILAARLDADLDVAISELAPPVCVLGVGDGAAAAWELACRRSDLAAVSLFDLDLSGLGPNRPLCPAIIELGMAGSATTPEAIEAFLSHHETVPLHPYLVAPGFIWRDGDAARLARLRTLQLFHRSCVSHGEMGG